MALRFSLPRFTRSRVCCSGFTGRAHHSRRAHFHPWHSRCVLTIERGAVTSTRSPAWRSCGALPRAYPLRLTRGAHSRRKACAGTLSGACCFGVLPAPAWRVNIEERNGRGACTPGVSLFRLTVPPFPVVLTSTTSSVACEHRGVQGCKGVARVLPARHCSGSRFPAHSCAGVCSGRTTSPRSRSGHGCNVAGHCSGSRAGGQAFPRVRVYCSGAHPVYLLPARALTSTTHGDTIEGATAHPFPALPAWLTITRDVCCSGALLQDCKAWRFPVRSLMRERV